MSVYFLHGVSKNAGEEDGDEMIPALHKSLSMQLDRVVGRCFKRICWCTVTSGEGIDALAAVADADADVDADADADADADVEKIEPICIHMVYTV